MPFTKAQRLKGLKKQLRNLGYDVVSRGGSTPPPEDSESETESSPGERGTHTIASLKAREDAW